MAGAKAVLQLLRSDPVEACWAYGFVVTYDDKVFPNYVGGPCKIAPSELNDNVYKLNAESGSGDFFFPYTHEGGLAGRCKVPSGQRDGTLVITGGMNGCALQVHKHDGYLMFYHDANGVQLSKEKELGGTELCRVDYDSYEGPLKMATKVTSKQNPYAFQTLISVKRGSKWEVVHTGILRSIKNKYSTYRSTITPLLTSFDD